ncbi:EAL domain-containing protein [Natranaerobius trueperi]|uniref:GGDEF domain-containing protein n=1 Tax=Natranaerobius trueperi TaxID=759412 RepID=A0A226BW24_9FIRM|nr:EAL domain-containing protein [Natranaerobius trueperi]OWZ83206.1 hypothetical protein CDO51_09925 [Natranaerobius trueperi]
MPKLKFYNSISNRFAIYFVIILIFGTSIIGFFTYKYMTNTLTGEVEMVVSQKADDVSQLIREKLNVYIYELEYLVDRDDINSMDWTKQQEVLSDHIEDSKYTGIAVVDRAGRARFINMDSVYVEDKSYINKALGGKTNFSDIIVSRVTNELVIMVASPIKHDGEIKGALVGRIGAHEVSELIENIQFGDEGYAYIVNTEGTIMAHKDKEFINSSINEIGRSDFENIDTTMEDEEQDISGYIDEGEKMYAGYSPIKDTNWLVGVSGARDELLDNLFEFQRMLGIIALLVILTGLMIAVYFGRKIAEPIELITVQAKSISEGDFSNSISNDLLKRKDELGFLGLSFKSMKENLIDMQGELEHMAYHDYMTGLPNRLAFKESFDGAIKNNQENNYFVLMLDLDNFKLINDTMGHLFGDRVIKKIANKLDNITTDDCTVYRMGGDEFILWSNCKKDKQAQDLAKNIVDSFNDSIQIDESNVPISFSIGIAFFPKDGRSIDELLTKADIALYQSKKNGNSDYNCYQDDMADDPTRKMKIEKELKTALDNKEFTLKYHPQYNTKTGKIWGFEALIRWKNPELGSVPPDEFIEVAEKNHFIIPIGEWVLDNAMRFLQDLYEQGYKGYSISVNISVIQLLQDDFVDTVINTVDKYNMPYPCLELEITETLMIKSFNLVDDKLNYLMEKGIKVALDDFGTGYSSLTYLRTLPFTTLKIDKGFVGDLTEKSVQGDLIASIIKIGNQVNSEVVAEGVETKEQLDNLRRNDCDRLQGYYFSKPLTKEEIVHFLLSEQKQQTT